MASLNKVILIGHLGRDPETRATAASTVCNFSVATSDRFKDRDGNQQEKTEWHRVVAWGRLAETCRDYLAKGRQVYVEGSLETREWTDKEGVKRYTTEVKAQTVLFIGEKGTSPSREESQSPRGGVSTRQAPADPPNDDDIPF